MGQVQESGKMGIIGSVIIAICTFGMGLYAVDAAIYGANPQTGTMLHSVSQVLGSATDTINSTTGIDNLIKMIE